MIYRSIVPVIFIALGAFLLFVAQSMAADAMAPAKIEQPAPAIRVVAAERRELAEFLHVNGTVLAREEAIVSTDLSGLTVLSLEADQGDDVETGAVLAILDRTPLEVQAAQIAAGRAQAEASVAQAKSQIADAEIAVRQASETLQRVQTLNDKGHATQAQFDAAVNAHDSARAKLNTARMQLTWSEAQVNVIDAQMRDVEIKLAKTEIRAPAGGLVLARNATLGGVVSAQSGALFRIAIGNELELAADVAETALPGLAESMPVKVKVAGSAEALDGKIRMIAPEVDRRTRLGVIRISLPGDPNVRVGNFASGEIEISRHSGVAVPASAIVYRGRQAFVQRVAEGLVSTVEVTFGSIAGGFVEIVDGLKPGDEVVHRAGTFVADGDRIQPIREETTGAVQQ